MITQEQIDAHAAWLRKAPGGIRLDLTGADLRGLDLARANLSRVDLTDANLTGANLYRVNLSRADLSGADLSGANLFEADLSGCILAQADLRDANLRNAFLNSANLAGAIGAIDAGSDPRGYRFVGVRHSDGWRIAAYQQWQTMAEARERWRYNRDALARLDVIEANT